LKLCISKIKDPQTSDEHKKEFVDELCHWSEELDLAKDFFTLGGLEILAPLLDHTNDEIRIQTCSLLATLVQNNDHCQRIIVQSGLQQKLLKIVEDTPNPELKTKAVTAISGKLIFNKLIFEILISFSLNSTHSWLYIRSTSITKISGCKSPNQHSRIANTTFTS